MNKKVYISLACALALNANAVDLGTISVESSTIDQKVTTQKAEVSSVQVITSSDVERINPKSVADILQSVPGVTMTLSGTDSLKVHIRGIDNQMYMGEKPGVAIVIDGVPVQETTGKINVDLDNIESIKVIKGGASYLYGNDAIAGAVVITTKRQKGISKSKIETEIGSFKYKRFLASTNQAFETGALQLQGSYTDTDGYWDDAFVTTKSINGKYQYYLSDVSDLTIGADFTRRETGDGNSVSGVTKAEENPTSAGEYSYGGYYNSDLTKLFVTYNRDFDNDANLMLRVHSYEDDKTSKSNRTKYDNAEKWDQNGLKAEYKKNFETIAFMVGTDIQRNQTDEQQYDAVDGIDQRGSKDGELREDYETKENVNALYTELKHQTTQDLITTLNLRYDDISHEYQDKMDDSNNVDPDYNTLSYRAGLNYALNKSNQLYTSVSTGFRTPTVGQTSQNKTSLAADPTLNIPSEIDVETTYNYEVGIEGKTEGNLAYNVSIYQLDRKDYIGRIAGSYISSDDEDESNYDNVGDMRSRGFELALNSDKSKTFSYDLAYTYLEAKFVNYTISQQQTVDPDGYGPLKATYSKADLSGNYVSRSPKHTANFAMNYKVNDKLTVSPEIYYKGSYFADEANKFKQKGYEVVNLKMNYNHSKALEFFAKIENLFDKDYYEFVNVNSSALATMEDATIRVAEPRTYYAGLRYKF